MKATDIMYKMLDEAELDLVRAELRELLADAVCMMASDEEGEGIGYNGSTAYALELALNRMCDTEEKKKALADMIAEYIDFEADPDECDDEDCCDGGCGCGCDDE